MGNFNTEEEKEFIMELFSYLIEKKNFCILKDNDMTIVVTSYDDDLAEIFIHAGTLKIIPQSPEGYFQVFMDVLEFLADRYRKEKLVEEPEDDDSTEDDGELWL